MTDLSRRGLLAGIFAACAAPAIVKAGIIMPIKPKLVMSPRDFYIGSAQITSTGPIRFMIHGEDQQGNKISERVQMSNGAYKQTEAKFWKILRVDGEMWDDPVVTIRDGLGNVIGDVPGNRIPHYMRSGYDEAVTKAIIDDTIWVDPMHGVKTECPKLFGLDPRYLPV